MKPHSKHLLAWILILATLCTLSVTALADGDGYNPYNPYVLKLRDDYVVYRYAQFSKFVSKTVYDGVEKNGYSLIFGLEDTTTDRALESLYCVDFPVDDGKGDINYQRLNLSDSTYAAALANKLRGIVLNTYPKISLEALADGSGVTGLTRGEAITASQMAIWKTAHGDAIQFTDIVCIMTTSGGSSDIQKELDAEGTAFENGTEEYKAAVKGRIDALYNYLLSLPVQKPTYVVASAASFTSKSTPTVTANEDGTCTVSVTTTVDVSLSGGDSLTLSAYLDDKAYYTTQALNSSGTYTLTISGVPADLAYGTVYLAIDGTQYGNDVYLVDANGIRGVSQSMIGVLEGTYPVHAEAKAEPDRVLNIQKTDGSGNGLSNISFNVYYVGSLTEYLSGSLGIGSKPTQSDIAKYAVSTRLVGTLTTNSSGDASLNLGAADGVYLVKELPNDAVTGAIAPFFVALPDYSRTDSNGNPAYTITAQPKNTVVEEKVDIKKSITEIDKKSDTFAVGQEHTWIIQTTIPKSIASGKAYVITDTLDSRLTYQKVEKMVLTDGTTETVLTAGTDYTVKYDDTSRCVTVALTSSGMQKIAGIVGSSYASYELRTYLVTQINQNAEMGTEIPNEAKIEFTNNVGRTYTDTSDRPEVHTGGALLKKVDANSKSPLASATFAVYREATTEDHEAGTAYEEFTVGETPRKLIPVSFYANADPTGNKVTSLTTDENGLGYIYGLPYGEYYLVETQAPAGYNKLPQPIKFTIDASSHLDAAHSVTVENTAGAVLPETGGIGTGWFTLPGLTMLLSAAVLLLKKRYAKA